MCAAVGFHGACARACTEIKSVLNERVSQTSAVVTRSHPPKPASLRDAGFAAPCGGAWCWDVASPLPVSGFVRGPLID